MIESVGTPVPCAPSAHVEDARENETAERRSAADDQNNARLHAETTPSRTARLPEQAPDRVDADVWSHLNSEEKDYFARVEALGPVTYGRGAQTVSAGGAQRGAHLDIRG